MSAHPNWYFSEGWNHQPETIPFRKHHSLLLKMVIYSGFTHLNPLNMMIFHCYVNVYQEPSIYIHRNPSGSRIESERGYGSSQAMALGQHLRSRDDPRGIRCARENSQWSHHIAIPRGPFPFEHIFRFYSFIILFGDVYRCIVISTSK